MKTRHILAGALCVASAAFVQNSNAQIGTPFIHDPSTIMECDGKYYTFGTGGGGLISEDGWTWNGGAERPGGGAAPDGMELISLASGCMIVSPSLAPPLYFRNTSVI